MMNINQITTIKYAVLLWPTKIYFMVILRAQTDIIHKTSGISFNDFITYSFEHAILEKYAVNFLMLDLINLILLKS
jgi:hypothetical protein